MSNTKFYGWKLVAILFLIYLSASIALVGGNITNTFMVKQIEMKRSIFGAGFALAFVLLGFASPLAALVAKKKGERFTLSIGMIGICGGALLMAFLGHTPAGYIGAYGLVIGTGSAFATVLPIQTIITRWFQRKRALATGLVLTGGGFAGIISAPLLNRLMESTNGNWKLAWFLMAALVGATAVVCFLFVRNNPADLGQVPDGSANTPQDEVNKQKETPKRVFQTNESWVLKEAFKTSSLWILLLAAAAQFMVYYLCLNHGMIHLMDIGVRGSTASLSLGILAFASVGGRLISGVLGDRIEPRFVIMGGLVLSLVGCLFLINPASTLFILLYALFVGHGFGLVYVCLFTMLGNYFGSEKIRNFLAFMIPIVTLFGASAPLLGGIIKDRTGSYSIAVIGVAVMAGLGAFSMLFASPPVKTSK